MKKKVIIIGSGFASLSASCYLAKAGFEVHVFEKNQRVGGRANILKRDGFQFDMGPSFYWMPDVFESFFNDFGKKIEDYFTLEKLSPSYKIVFDQFESLKISDEFKTTVNEFEKIETGAGKKLEQFIKEAGENYQIAIKEMVYKPGKSAFELVTLKTIRKINLFYTNIREDIFKRFKNEKLRKALEFPVLFLGAKPQNTPAFYNFMNYADFSLGTWYPMGGMYSVVQAMYDLADDLGVQFHLNTPIQEILTINKEVVGVYANNKIVTGDYLLSGADYQHTEQLLPEKFRSYTQKFWESKTFAPSALLYFVGFKTKLKNLNHHTLFFDENFDDHAKQIYDTKEWPEKPLFYASFPSMTDDKVAPEGMEAGTFLIPIAPGLIDDQQAKEKYLNILLERIEKYTGQNLKEQVLFSESYAVSDFIKDYNSYKGNAYGLANTMKQTAFLRPKIQSKKLNNLFFTGQLTVPGPGVPPALISGKIAAESIINTNIKTNNYAKTI